MAAEHAREMIYILQKSTVDNGKDTIGTTFVVKRNMNDPVWQVKVDCQTGPALVFRSEEAFKRYIRYTLEDMTYSEDGGDVLYRCYYSQNNTTHENIWCILEASIEYDNLLHTLYDRVVNDVNVLVANN